jgi:hypothetical protein
MNGALKNRYTLLLAALVLLLVLHPLLRGTGFARVFFGVFVTLVFVAAVLAQFTGPRRRLLVALVGAPPILGLWSGYALPGLPRVPVALGFHGSAAVFLAIVVAAMLWDISHEDPVSRDSVMGAFCGYVLLGLFFGHIYCVIEEVAPGSFEGRGLLPERLPPGDELFFLLTYFSMVTLTTVGYGDIFPASDAVRGLANVEAIAGQFYIAVLIAELIGRRLAARTSPGGAATDREGTPAPSAAAGTSPPA